MFNYCLIEPRAQRVYGWDYIFHNCSSNVSKYCIVKHKAQYGTEMHENKQICKLLVFSFNSRVFYPHDSVPYIRSNFTFF
jgi:hypothetical protein